MVFGLWPIRVYRAGSFVRCACCGSEWVRVNGRRVAVSGVGAICLLLVPAGCTADRVGSPRVQGLPGPGDGGCNPVAAKSTVVGLLKDLTAGRHVAMTTRFVAPQAFVRWIGPDAGQITADPGTGGATLASLSRDWTISPIRG